MNSKSNFFEQGYIALISAIVISAVLIVISVAISTAGFFSRFNVLDKQAKEQSRNLARACLDKALLNLAENPNQLILGDIAVGNESCAIVGIFPDSPIAGQLRVQTRAVVNQAATNIEATVSAQNLDLLSWREPPNL